MWILEHTVPIFGKVSFVKACSVIPSTLSILIAANILCPMLILKTVSVVTWTAIKAL